MTRPNILYIHSHDTGRYIQPYGHAVATPNLQALAANGVLFRHAFCAAPTCSPSRAALLTGQAAHSSGMLGLAHDFASGNWALHDYSQHILHTLRREASYHSALCGIQHIARGLGDQAQDAAVIGYDRVFPRPNAEEHAVAWLDDAPPQPFYLEVGFFETHRLGNKQAGAFNDGGPPGDDRYARPPAPLPDAPDVRRDMADYAVSAARLDAKMGQIFDALKRNGLWDNTLIIATTDHGIAFPGMKCHLTDGGTGVFLILHGPGFQGGQVVDGLVSHIDVFPTVCDLLEIAPPAWLQGRSVMPLVRGEAEEINDAIFGEITYHAAYDPQRAVRTRRWKYIRGWHQTPRPLLMNCDDGISKRFLAAHGGGEQFLAQERLYDLVFDPNETRNLADDPTHVATRDELRARLEQWMRDTDDPLLNGSVPPSQPPRASEPWDVPGTTSL